MPGCCSPYHRAAERQFDETKVAQEVKKYQDHGLGPTTRLLEEEIAQSGVSIGTVLDIGSGIGTLALALLDRGATSAVTVDASSAYVKAARAEAHRRGRTDAIRFVLGDFVALADQLAPASVVTLDRVVCCYPWSEPLLAARRRACRAGLRVVLSAWRVVRAPRVHGREYSASADKKSIPHVRSSTYTLGACDQTRRVRAGEPTQDMDVVHRRVHTAGVIRGRCG